MITARSPLGVLRARISTGPLRLLWLALLLTGLVYAHGVDTRGASHHWGDAPVSGAVSLPRTTAAHDGVAHGAVTHGTVTYGTAPHRTAPHGAVTGRALAAHDALTDRSVRPAEHCMPGQSEQGTTVQGPAPGPLARPGSTSCGHAPRRPLPPATGRADSPVPAIPDGPGLLRI